jgi:hypothetical protein
VSQPKEFGNFLTDADMNKLASRPAWGQEKMKKMIERAAELPEGQVLTISGHSITRGQLLAALQEKGMGDGNVVWLHVHVACGCAAWHRRQEMSQLLYRTTATTGPEFFEGEFQRTGT